jgi:flavin reductase (DIM6/NTAB) family NADH-FMN oxidoreductase RutF
MQIWKPGNMLYPVPAVMVSCRDKDGNTNFFTAAWTGTVCSDPAMVYISVRPSRYSYKMIEETGEFVINLTTDSLAHATDLAGVKSGRDVDKWKECKLTKGEASKVKAPIIKESPVNIECKVTQIIKLGSHDMFLAEVLAVDVDEKYVDKKGSLNLKAAGLMAYSHGRYYSLGKQIGKFGFSVKKKKSGR